MGSYIVNPPLPYIYVIFTLNCCESTMVLNSATCIFNFKSMNLRVRSILAIKSLSSGMTD